jgi:hypothetical protein
MPKSTFKIGTQDAIQAETPDWFELRQDSNTGRLSTGDSTTLGGNVHALVKDSSLTFADLAAAKTMDNRLLGSGQVAMMPATVSGVPALIFYRWDATSTATADDDLVIRPTRLTSGQAGRWLKVVANSGRKADLGSDGKLLPSQLPDLAIGQWLGTAANQAAMLALTGQRGDWCERTDETKNYLLIADDPTLIGSWRALAYPGVTGAVRTDGTSTMTGALVFADGAGKKVQLDSGYEFGRRVSVPVLDITIPSPGFLSIRTPSGEVWSVNEAGQLVAGTVPWGSVTGKVNANATTDGLMTATYASKLDGIDAGAKTRNVPASTGATRVPVGDGSGGWTNSASLASASLVVPGGDSFTSDVGVFYFYPTTAALVPGGSTGLTVGDYVTVPVGCITAPYTIQYKDHSGTNKTMNLTNGIVTSIS